ncbi:Zonadhesin [Fukomys damarensis]|uniref:Zonadhesin n=1 Tax=Fukomys damarensis TaxID=885580 RepID=A0A091E2D4_FUKDA|nr:Zonadhesin [Fukomys damarensis]
MNFSAEETTVPIEEPPVIPTEKPLKECAPPCLSSALLPLGPTAMMTPSDAPTASMVSVIPATTTNPIPTTASCPSNAHYEPCGCPVSCESPRPSCGPLCQQGCICNPGFLLSGSQCINASSCSCIYGGKSYKPGEEWFSPNCTEHCCCWMGGRMECQLSQCGTHTVCQLKNGQYGCHPYGSATCLVYRDPHYVTFDERHIGFTGKCTYILAQSCHNSTEPFFRVTAKNEEQGQEGVSCLSKVYVTLLETTVKLLRGRQTMVEGHRVTLPAVPAEGVFVGPSGRFVELQTEFGLRVRWDGEQQLFVTVSSTYAGKLCSFCGNYDGDGSNDNLKPDGNPARDDEELGYSWQVAEDEDRDACPDTCHSAFSNKPCPGSCVEACECNPGFVLSGLECVPWAQCGCLSPSGSYFKLGERWYKPGCREFCVCQSKNHIHCQPWRCRAQEACGHQNGQYGCYTRGSATCTALGDPHYLTFDGAMHHFLGTCIYTLSQPCWSQYPENHFVVSATNEILNGDLQASYVKAVHVQVFDLKISLIKGHRVMLNGLQVNLPVWLSKGQVTIQPSGSFILLYTNSGLQVRYDGNHLVEVTVPSSYAGQLCRLCGNYNNNSMDDNLRPDRKPAGSSSQLVASWRSSEGSEPGCFLGAEPSSCPEDNMADMWSKDCEILMNPLAPGLTLLPPHPPQPFSNCHHLVHPQASFASCVQGQCGTKGDALALCGSLQAYASLCALAGQAPAWRNSTFCPPRCPPNSRYSPCARPCPATCLSLSSPKDCPATLPCTEGCECQKGHVLSGTFCVPLSQCGCMDPKGFYRPAGESWYPERTCTSRCTCLVHNNITCHRTACQEDQVCWPRNGLLGCWTPGAGICKALGDSEYMGFGSSSHPVQDMCPHVLVKVCHPNMELPAFKINGTPVTLPATSQITGLSITSNDIYTMVHLQTGVCHGEDEQAEENLNGNCRPEDLKMAQEHCQEVLQAPVWAECAAGLAFQSLLLGCTNKLSLECPAHSSYTTCIPSCPPSCWDLGGHCEGAKVPSICSEGCVCQPGYVLKSQYCSIFGDPHCHTFDGRSYRFQGRMTYILVKTVSALPDSMQHLVVEGCNKMYSPTGPVFLHEVITTVYGYKVQFQKDLVLLVNSQKMAMPYRPNEHLRVTLRGQRLYLITDFKLVLSFDGRNNAGT